MNLDNVAKNALEDAESPNSTNTQDPKEGSCDGNGMEMASRSTMPTMETTLSENNLPSETMGPQISEKDVEGSDDIEYAPSDDPMSDCSSSGSHHGLVSPKGARKLALEMITGRGLTTSNVNKTLSSPQYQAKITSSQRPTNVKRKGKLDEWERNLVDQFVASVRNGTMQIPRGQLARSLLEYVNPSRDITFYEKLVSRRRLNIDLAPFLGPRLPKKRTYRSVVSTDASQCKPSPTFNSMNETSVKRLRPASKVPLNESDSNNNLNKGDALDAAAALAMLISPIEFTDKNATAKPVNTSANEICIGATYSDQDSSNTKHSLCKDPASKMLSEKKSSFELNHNKQSEQRVTNSSKSLAGMTESTAYIQSPRSSHIIQSNQPMMTTSYANGTMTEQSKSIMSTFPYQYLPNQSFKPQYQPYQFYPPETMMYHQNMCSPAGAMTCGFSSNGTVAASSQMNTPWCSPYTTNSYWSMRPQPSSLPFEKLPQPVMSLR